MPGKQVFAAIACIFDQEGNILLQQRRDPSIPDAHGKWEFPGGKVEYGETPEQAIIRECREEIGCDVAIDGSVINLWSALWSKIDGTEFQAFVASYRCHITNGKPRPHNDEVATLRWFSQTDALHMDALPGVKETIQLTALRVPT